MHFPTAKNNSKFRNIEYMNEDTKMFQKCFYLMKKETFQSDEDLISKSITLLPLAPSPLPSERLAAMFMQRTEKKRDTD